MTHAGFRGDRPNRGCILPKSDVVGTPFHEYTPHLCRLVTTYLMTRKRNIARRSRLFFEHSSFKVDMMASTWYVESNQQLINVQSRCMHSSKHNGRELHGKEAIQCVQYEVNSDKISPLSRIHSTQTLSRATRAWSQAILLALRPPRTRSNTSVRGRALRRPCVIYTTALAPLGD